MANFDIRSLPKISLHDHLDGGLRPQTIIELAAEVGFEARIARFTKITQPPNAQKLNKIH